MKNSCWFFGDSFTYGQRCHPGDIYYEDTYQDGDRRWTTIVSDTLEFNEKVIARPGDSNNGILHTLINNLTNIKSNDWVIVGDTRPYRLDTFNEYGERKNVINDPLEGKGYTRGEKTYILDYIYHEILPNENNYIKFYEEMFNGILNELKLRNVNTIFWSHSLWYPLSISKFSRITTDLNSEVDDAHWSWKGHEQFSKHILSIINEKSLI